MQALQAHHGKDAKAGPPGVPQDPPGFLPAPKADHLSGGTHSTNTQSARHALYTMSAASDCCAPSMPAGSCEPWLHIPKYASKGACDAMKPGQHGHAGSQAIPSQHVRHFWVQGTQGEARPSLSMAATLESLLRPLVTPMHTWQMAQLHGAQALAQPKTFWWTPPRCELADRPKLLFMHTTAAPGLLFS